MYIEITIPRIKKLLSLRHFSFVTLSQNATSLLRWRLTSFLLTHSANHRGVILSPLSANYQTTHILGRGWRLDNPGNRTILHKQYLYPQTNKSAQTQDLHLRREVDLPKAKTEGEKSIKFGYQRTEKKTL